LLVQEEPIRQWLQRNRRTNDLQMDLVALYHDLDGALAAGQFELAWRTKDKLLVGAVHLHLRTRNINYPDDGDFAGETAATMSVLAGINERLAADVWRELLEPAPLDSDRLLASIERSRDLIHVRLGAPDSREDAIRSWADGVKVLREIAHKIGIAQDNSWYVPEQTADADPELWYEEIMRVLDSN
jgi:hypothetical protein